MSLFRLAYLGMTCLFVFGCSSGEHEDIKQWMADSSKDLRGRVPPLPELKPFPVVSYEPAGTQDPFSAARIDPEKKESGANKPDLNRPREQLENFPIESINFVGVVREKKGAVSHALVHVEGLVYRAAKGNYLGQNYGRIINITDTEIVIIESVQDPTGQSTDWIEREVSLQMREGGAQASAKESNK